MKILSAEQYVQLIEENVPGSFASLHSHRFLLKKGGIHLSKRGRNTIIFKTESHSKFYAIRFLLNDEPELFQRYAQLQNYLNTKSFSWKVPFEFLENEYYPIVKMDWIDSLSLSEYLNLIITNPRRISQLQSILVALSRNLEKNGIAHGNLNLKHICLAKLDQEFVIKLIDYDSMFVPSFKGKHSLSPGSASFQHPMRLASNLYEKMDRFSFWVFLTALEAFKTDPSLWIKAEENGYNKTEQILFSFRDFAFPQQSKVFNILKNYNKEELNFYVDKLMEFCSSKSLSTIEAPQIYTQRNSDRIRREKSSIGTKITADNSGQTEQEKTTTPKASPSKEQSFSSNRPAANKEAIVERDEIVHFKVQSKLIKQNAESSGKKKVGRTVVIVTAAAVLLFTSAYFVNLHHTTGNKVKTTSMAKLQAEVPMEQMIILPKPFLPKETVFTKANATQFLSQLYLAYNKRDIQSILSNYAYTVSYYDAGALTKNKLSDVIRNLFIQPAFYECHPDLKTLQLNVQGDNCKLMISIQEMIKLDKNDDAENYASKIEYTVDRSFKIHAENRVD